MHWIKQLKNKNMTTRETIIEIINRLFVYVDSQQWEILQSEVLSASLFVDMSSVGGEATDLAAKEVCKMWQDGLIGIDSVNHLAGNYLVDIISENEANVFAYATATHYKKSAKKGKTREFVGSYDLKLRNPGQGWRIYSITYNLKFVSGNIELE